MSIQEIIREVDELTDEEQRQLLLHISHRQEMKDPAYVDNITEALDDDSPGQWVRWEDVKKELADEDD